MGITLRLETKDVTVGTVYMNITSLSGHLAFGVYAHDPGLKFAHPRTISSWFSALRRNFILGSKIHGNTWFLSVLGRNEIFLCLPAYDQWWMIILCISVYDKDGHFVMNRFASITKLWRKAACCLCCMYCITEAEDSNTATELSYTIMA